MFVADPSIQSDFKGFFAGAGSSLGPATLALFSLAMGGFWVFLGDFSALGKEESEEVVVVVFSAFGFLEESEL